jgi:two-component system NtrC family response regulator
VTTRTLSRRPPQRVALVEGDRDVRAVLEQVLRSERFIVVATGENLAQVRGVLENVDVLVLDLDTVDVNLDAETLVQATARLAVVGLTGVISRRRGLSPEHLGIRSFLAKPFAVETFLSSIATVRPVDRRA